MNLVVSDLLFVFTLPLRVFYFINQNWPFGSMLCKVSVSLFYTNMYGSMLFLTCISVDRFLAIVHPFRSRALRTKRNARIVCIAVWVLVLSGSLPTGFMLETTSPEKRQTNATFCFENFSSKQWKSHLSKVVIFIETVGFIIPLLLNVCCSIMVLQTLRRPQTISRGGGKLNKTKILRMIIVHLLIFCFCFIPYNVNLVFYALVRTKTLKGCFVESVVRTIYPIALCIAVSNCCFDPIVYYFTSETIQNSIKRKSQVSRSYDAKFSEALQSETSSNLQCSLKNIKAKVFHNESSVWQWFCHTRHGRVVGRKTHLFGTMGMDLLERFMKHLPEVLIWSQCSSQGKCLDLSLTVSALQYYCYMTLCSHLWIY